MRLMVQRPRPSKLVMRVRFSSPAPSDVPSRGSFRYARMRLQKSALGRGPQRGPLPSGPPTRPLSPSFGGLRRGAPVRMDPFGRSLLLTPRE